MKKILVMTLMGLLWALPVAAQIEIKASSAAATSITSAAWPITAPAGGDYRVTMATPAAPTITQNASGTLANGTYKMTVTAIDAGGGQTLYPTAVNCVVSAASNDGCIGTWTAVAGAVTYRLWISDADGATPVQYKDSGGYVSTTITTLSGLTVAALPSSATAYVTNLDGTTASWVSGVGLASGPWSVGIGPSALVSDTTGHANTAVGYRALASNTTGSGQTAFGEAALASATVASTNDVNTAVGAHALELLTTGNGNVFMGYSAGAAMTGGSSNTAIGAQAMGIGVQTGSSNVAVGFTALADNTTGANNVAVGHGSLRKNTEAGANTAIGQGALASVLTGQYNTAVGTTALNKTTGSGNTAVGEQALGAYVGSSATAVGWRALYQATGTDNTAFGDRAGYAVTTGTGNVFLGKLAGYYETGSNKLFIDNTNRTNEADGRTKALIYGVFDAAVANQALTINAGTFRVTGNIVGTTFQVGATAGADCTSAANVTVAKGIVTACSQPDPLLTPQALAAEIAALKQQIAELQAALGLGRTK